ncbi:hypothetical protein BDZ91DRAFT_163015 [Kalaharituber pfeilii]|nr:hypothetical protein BDZ91DRAFT_163015 [Kalaharituber pfeilii]
MQMIVRILRDLLYLDSISRNTFIFANMFATLARFLSIVYILYLNSTAIFISDTYCSFPELHLPAFCI